VDGLVIRIVHLLGNSEMLRRVAGPRTGYEVRAERRRDVYHLHIVRQSLRPGGKLWLEAVAGRADVVEELLDDDLAIGGIQRGAVGNLDVMLRGDRLRLPGMRGDNDTGKQHPQ
jgi:hypothetical protein